MAVALPNKILLLVPVDSPCIFSPVVSKLNFFNFASNEPVWKDICSNELPAKNEPVKNTLSVANPNPLTLAPSILPNKPDKSPIRTFNSVSKIPEPVLSMISI